MKTLVAGLAFIGSLSHGYVTSMPFLSSPRRSTGAPANSNNIKTGSHLFSPPSLAVRGGGAKKTTALNAEPAVSGISTALTSLWGVGGVLYILSKAITRVLPIALEPFAEGAVALSKVQLGFYVATCLWFAYVEGYKGFQTKFSPLVVKRSFTLIPGESHILHILLAPFYSMGLLHATKTRKIVSWSVTLGVTVLVALVKKLPYPYRNIVDAGVVAGLSWGSISMFLWYVRSWVTGIPPPINPSLPESKEA